jgi:8-amino-7-oxononanoate synthase
MTDNEKSFESELRELEARGLRRSVGSPGSDITNLSSNDYLGLAQHPVVKQAAAEAALLYGAGGTSSRLLAGTARVHEDLESTLAQFLAKESALVFSSGYHTNTGAIPALTGSGDLILFDRLCHASIVDGVRLSDARFATFEHNDAEDLEAQLKKRRAQYRRCVIITEGIFSMDGDQPPLPRIVELARHYDAWIYLDEAHSIGLWGPSGQGVAAEQGVLGEIDFHVGTLSKSFGTQGGFIAASRVVREVLISKCRSFIFTTALAPSCAAAGLAALHLFPALDDRRQALLGAARVLRESLRTMGFDTLTSNSQIVPIWTGDIASTKRLSDHLFRQGFFVPSIRPPTVPSGEGRVRVSLTHDSIQKGVAGLAEAFAGYAERPRRIKDHVEQKS